MSKDSNSLLWAKSVIKEFYLLITGVMNFSFHPVPFDETKEYKKWNQEKAEHVSYHDNL